MRGRGSQADLGWLGQSSARKRRLHAGLSHKSVIWTGPKSAACSSFFSEPAAVGAVAGRLPRAGWHLRGCEKRRWQPIGLVLEAGVRTAAGMQRKNLKQRFERKKTGDLYSPCCFSSLMSASAPPRFVPPQKTPPHQAQKFLLFGNPRNYVS